ncbi:YopX family protein [Bacillus litorisediminis]|uniref:YopX family protein n=1 Tax=Bacillus litorisediminis TaxID=2922713 RepID=UPI001FABFF4F|nr:YopX family protein [Bacillus litorisediminis]
MREIKFRAWNQHQNKMLDWDYLRTTCPMSHFSSDLEFMQYTGLTDKNGNPIYEGDIIKQEYNVVFQSYYDPVTFGFEGEESEEGHHIGEVVILASKGACMRKPLRIPVDAEPEISNQYKNVAGYRCEVIGNIYENPELLEQT